jgi:hypothetical protein
MNSIRQFLDERGIYVALVGGAVVGLAIGLLVGWVVWPVQWTDATPAHLHESFQDDYLLYVVERYESSGGADWAKEQLARPYWDDAQLAAAFDRVEERTQGETRDLLLALKRALIETPAEEAVAEAETEPSETEEPTTLDRMQPFLLVCGVALVVAAIVGGVILLFGRKRGIGGKGTVTARGSVLGDAGGDIFGEPGTGPENQIDPQAQFVTSYSLGDDHYDPSFSIELETGEFMGECGVGISDTLGAGEPSKVTAFEIWLFDKNDIRTVTKVLMSEYAFGDEALRTKLAPKGEPILAKVGDHVVLETKRLRVQARLLDLAYGDGDVPASSYFSRLTLDLTAWVKPGQQGDAAASDETPFL